LVVVSAAVGARTNVGLDDLELIFLLRGCFLENVESLVILHQVSFDALQRRKALNARHGIRTQNDSLDSSTWKFGDGDVKHLRKLHSVLCWKLSSDRLMAVSRIAFF
jgi:hypothetical protein